MTEETMANSSPSQEQHAKEEVRLRMSGSEIRTGGASHEFTCKTCNRKFVSYQALGGHRAVHKRSLSFDERMLGNRDWVYPRYHSSSRITSQRQLDLRAWDRITELTEGIGRRLRKKVEALRKKPEGISKELLIGLLAATCQNLAQITTLSTSDNAIRRNVLMTANGGGFLLLLCGMLRRSRGVGGDFGNLLIFFGILLSTTGILMNMSVNISGVSGFLVPAVCLLLVLAALLC